jgi:hypothetical protein
MIFYDPRGCRASDIQMQMYLLMDRSPTSRGPTHRLLARPPQPGTLGPADDVGVLAEPGRSEITEDGRADFGCQLTDFEREAENASVPDIGGKETR